LFALGVPRSKVYTTVLAQAFWVGILGVILAYPTVHALAFLAQKAGAQVVLRWEVLVGAAIITLGTAVFSGFLALRAVRTIEPMTLLR
ncbi:MAG: FtsX-like permease family protein, partial [Gemmataceae bacterium]